jgi:hypothetical protein
MRRSRHLRTRGAGRIACEHHRAVGVGGLLALSRDADAESHVAERDQVAVLDVDTLDGTIVEVREIDRAEVLENELIPLPGQLTLLTRDMRAVQLERALGAPTDENGVQREVERLTDVRPCQYLDLEPRGSLCH